jgi:5-formyltetrahydrofolate cyclo-ligase
MEEKMIKKKIVRDGILLLRKKMTKEEVQQKSQAILEQLIQLKEYKDSSCVSIYLSFANEVDTFMIINKMKSHGKKIVIPYTDASRVELIPVYLEDPSKDLTMSAFGYPEPIFERAVKAQIEDIDLVIVPGVAFDVTKNRIGFGKGYYDKYLSKMRPEVKKIAVAYDYQVLESIPSEDHDVKMDYVMTESRIVS